MSPEEHLGLVYSEAKKLSQTSEVCIRAFGTNIENYIGEGYIALQRAKENFDPSLGNTFATYACAAIRSEIIQAARRFNLIKIGSQARYHAIKAINGEQIGQENQKKVKQALKVLLSKFVSSTELNDRGTKDKDPEWELTEELSLRMNQLDERTKEVLILRFGLNDEDPYTLEEVGKKLTPQITRERVRQIEKKGLEKLRELLNT